MTTHRFQVTPVKEYTRDKNDFQPSEIIPLINIEKDTPSIPSRPSSLMLINETNKVPIRLTNTFTQRLKPNSSSPTDLIQKTETSSLPNNHSNSTTNLNVNKETDEPDSATSTFHTLDTNSFGITNKFLHELRLKRRELHLKARNLSIDQRIALNHFQYKRDIRRAQDLFDVHFELNDDDNNTTTTNMKYDIFNENTQEQIRNNIFNELDRQRIKQFHKQHRQLVLGRALLMFVTSLILFMSITLIYVVIDLYNRADYLDKKLTDNEFISMIYDDSNHI